MPRAAPGKGKRHSQSSQACGTREGQLLHAITFAACVASAAQACSDVEPADGGRKRARKAPAQPEADAQQPRSGGVGFCACGPGAACSRCPPQEVHPGGVTHTQGSPDEAGGLRARIRTPSRRVLDANEAVAAVARDSARREAALRVQREQNAQRAAERARCNTESTRAAQDMEAAERAARDEHARAGAARAAFAASPAGLLDAAEKKARAAVEKAKAADACAVFYETQAKVDALAARAWSTARMSQAEREAVVAAAAASGAAASARRAEAQSCADEVAAELEHVESLIKSNGDLQARLKTHVRARKWSAAAAASGAAESRLRTSQGNFRKKCLALFALMTCCAYCGVVALGGDASSGVMMESIVKPAGIEEPPYAVANVFMRQYCSFSKPSAVTGAADTVMWNVCSLCAKKPRTACVAYHTMDLMRAVVTADPLHVQQLALVDLGLGFTRKIEGFAHCVVSKRTLLDGALVQMNPVAQTSLRPTQVPLAIAQLLVQLRNTNVYCQRYLSLLERNHPVHGIPVLSRAVVAAIVDNAINRNPLLGTEADPLRLGQFAPQFAALVDVTPAYTAVGGAPHRNAKYELGHIVLRQAAVAVRDAAGGAQPAPGLPGTILQVLADGSPAGAASSLPSLEMALFPFMFPAGAGDYKQLVALGIGLSFVQCVRMRVNSLFSLNTLYKPYLPLAYMLRQSCSILEQFKERALNSQLMRLWKRFPNATPAHIYKNVLRSGSLSSKPGTPMWFKRQLEDLLAVVNERGLPTCFVTLTADEVSSTRFVEINALEELLNLFLHGNEDGPATFGDAPVECARAFLSRHDIFMKDFLLGGEQILGKVTYHMVRFEVQGRGSLHSHILLWLDPVDALHLKHEIIAYLPATLGHDAVIPEGSDVDAERARLFSSEEIELRQAVLRKQTHKCDTRCKGPGMTQLCKDMHPYAPNESGTAFNHATKRWDYLRPAQKETSNTTGALLDVHRNVSPYHPVLLFLWGAHVNVQMITATAWSLYVLKYTTKTEPSGPINVTPQDAEHLGLQGMTEAQCSLVSAAVLSKPVSPCEAALTCIQQGSYATLVDLGAHVEGQAARPEVIDCRPPHVRSRVISAAGVENRGSGLSRSPMELYIQRPGLRSVTFMQYFLYYERAKPGSKQFQRCSTNFTRVCGDAVDDEGNAVFLRVPPGAPPGTAPSKRFVRFTLYRPSSSTNEWAYTVLLKYVPFQHESELSSGINRARTRGGAPAYYIELLLRGIIDTEDDLEDLVREYTVQMCEDTDRVATMIDRITAKYPFGMDLTAYQVAADDESDDDAAEPTPFEYSPEELAEFEHLDSLEPNEQQAQFIDAMKASTGGVHFLSGGPGCGKTFVSQKCIRWARHNGKRVLVLATTGAAAQRLSRFASTIHTGMAISTKYGAHELGLASEVLHAVAQADWIFIDEVSMLTLHLLQNIMLRMRRTVRADNVRDILKTKTLVFVGDLAQLPPVCRCKVPSGTVCERCHITKHWLWTEPGLLARHALSVSMRHITDPVYVAFLNVVRVLRPTLAQLKPLRDRCITEREVVNKMVPDPVTRRVDSRILCTHREDVLHYNDLMLNHLFSPNEIFTPGISHSAGSGATGDLQSFIEQDDDPDFNTLKHAAIGCLVIFNHGNDYMSAGAANGCTGYLVGRSSQRGRDALDVLTEHGVVVRVKRTVEKKFVYNNGVRYVEFTKRAYPLELAYAITAHKSQGCTVPGNVILKVRDAFAPGMLYVMLSRVTMLSKLWVVGYLRPDMFTPIPAAIRGESAG